MPGRRRRPGVVATAAGDVDMRQFRLDMRFAALAARWTEAASAHVLVAGDSGESRGALVLRLGCAVIGAPKAARILRSRTHGRGRLPIAMSRPIGGPDGLNPMLVLGALVERPANRYELDQRLQRRFKSAELPRGTARYAIKKLVRDGFVRLQASSPRRGRGAIYEPTDAGLAEFREWLRAKVQVLPIREELIGKVGMCQPEDVSQLVEVAQDAEQDLMAVLDALNRRVRERRRKLDPRSWATRIDLAISCADHAAIGGRVCFAQQIHRHLAEELSQPDGGRPSAPPGMA